MDCGIACLRMIAAHHGRYLSTNDLRTVIKKAKDGVSLADLYEASDKLGFKASGVEINLDQLKRSIKLPCILHWENQHFVVLHKIRRRKFYLADPSYGHCKLSTADFSKSWLDVKRKKGIALLLEPRSDFVKGKKEEDRLSSLKMSWTYLSKHAAFLKQLLLALFFVSLIQLSFPFITQSVVDYGIRLKDLGFIQVLLFAQLFLFLGRTSIEAIRAWVLLHMSSRISIQMLSDYFIKLMRLPFSFFDVRMTGDILQRVNDHKRIEALMTNGSLNFLFSIFNLIVFGLVLLSYDWRIFGLFFIGSALYVIWILIFMRERKRIDYQRFGKMGEDQSMIIEMINGMREIKLNNAERLKRWQWEDNQISLYQIGIKGLKLEQVQGIIGNVINELKNILLTFLSAYLVVKGEITLGMMLAISFILGQLNSPLSQLIGFSYTFQDAKIAFERLKEVYSLKDERDEVCRKINDREGIGIKIENLSFTYPASRTACIRSISLEIPTGKTTAIVGKSGSGKSSLMKLLLQFYTPDQGKILINDRELNGIDKQQWRSICGVVMQDGHIFNDSIEGNICMGSKLNDSQKLDEILELANLKEWIRELPLGVKTQIGMEGVGLSGGQKQRILIARALYKDPKFILFDEATSSLDAANEREISHKLGQYFKKRTVVIIAHRLSTVRYADQIVVMDAGEILECGSHFELLATNGHYAKLLDRQIEKQDLIGMNLNSTAYE
jgi:ATP-binding cassette subfamily B protein